MRVNKDVFETNWEQIRARSRVWWGLFSDEDLNKVEKAPIKHDKYAMLLRVKYGYTHERAREEINQRIIDLEASSSGNEITLDSPDRQTGSKVSKVRKKPTKKSNF